MIILLSKPTICEYAILYWDDMVIVGQLLRTSEVWKGLSKTGAGSSRQPMKRGQYSRHIIALTNSRQHSSCAIL